MRDNQDDTFGVAASRMIARFLEDCKWGSETQIRELLLWNGV